ncbi:enoyl-CoA hydratase-related protein [Pseudooceanicola aestuarii]|uniref:enoyl-CoA hydratase-related protein n=1 Tax=Pseudooceanicola aestuarii TaxID=2697319 RepID=UPI0013D34D32|nr:enoyl-CoA hydratase-related protein [Pseudooceanicola aestuarii]
MKFVETETRGALRLITLSRPEAKNALNADLCAQLLDALNDAAADPAVRAVVLTGADGTFCVGGDVKAFNAGDWRNVPAEDRQAQLRGRMELSRVIHEMEKPVVAAIEGAAAGAGLSIALACDFRVCAATAKITTAFAKVGLSGDFGGTWFMTQLIGAALARELYLFSPILSGKEADAIGLMTQSVDDGTALEHALEMAEQLSRGPTLAYGRMKSNLNAAANGATLAEVMDLEAANHTASTGTADHKEAAAAFVEKRRPNFTGS